MREWRFPGESWELYGWDCQFLEDEVVNVGWGFGVGVGVD